MMSMPTILTMLRNAGPVSVAVAAMALAAPYATAADMLDSTQSKEDARRAHSGAKVTFETNPGNKDTANSDSERVNESYQAKGYELGKFLLLPKVEVDEVYNSNIFAAQSNNKADTITVIRPELKLRSRFTEHELTCTVVAENFRYKSFSHDDRTELEGNVDGRYDFSSHTQATLFTSLYSRHEDRGSPDDARGLEPTPTRGSNNRLGLKHQFNRLTIVGQVEANRFGFGNVTGSDGSMTVNSDRNRWEFLARERASYEIFPGYAAVVEVSENTHVFDRDQDRNGYNRNNSGYRTEAGIGVDISELVRGDFLVGYYQQNYKDSRFQDPSGLSWRATFNWTPTKLTIVIPSFERTVTETTTQQASALVRNVFSVTVRHELQRNIILTGTGSVSYDQLSGVGGQNAWNYEGRAKAIYAFTREFYVGAEIGYKTKNSQLADGGYRQLTSMVRLGVQY